MPDHNMCKQVHAMCSDDVVQDHESCSLHDNGEHACESGMAVLNVHNA